jgi:diguanylate cyclase (GGDEF)-like protein/PAS domain S-box-containing protein/putative nucleotidyltransferase with HDIG domain
MKKNITTINVLLVERTGRANKKGVFSLLHDENRQGLKVTASIAPANIRKIIAGGEAHILVTTIPPQDTIAAVIGEALKTAPHVPVLVIGEENIPLSNYPFPVREFRTRGESDAFLLRQVIRSIAESGGVGRDFDRKIEEYHSSEARFLNVILSSADGIVVVNKRGKILFVNPAARSMLGPALDVWKNRFPFSALDGELSEVKGTSESGLESVLEMRSVATVWEKEEARLISLRDITSRKNAETSLRASEERYALAVQGSKDGLWDWDLKRDAIYFHPQWKGMLGYGDDEIGDRPDEWFSRVNESDIRRVRKALNAHLDGGAASFKSEHRIRHRDGGYRWVLVRATALRNRNGKAVRIAGSMTDITERKKAERQLKKALSDLQFALASEKILMEELDRKNKELVELSITDGLTGLYNHRFLQERFDFEYKRLRRYGGTLSLMIIDIDLFKGVNDTYGHQFGDFVLRELGRLLKAKSREVDICGRYGGEEFMIITNLPGDEIMKYANKLHSAVENNLFSANGHNVHITVSIGIAEYHNEIKSKQELIERADRALYQAKKDGRNLIRLWKEVAPSDERTVDRSGIDEFKKQFISISNQMRSAYMEATDALIKAVDAKDPFAREHSHNVSRYAVEIAKWLNLPAHEIEVIKYAGLLHDIGKIGIKQEILTKKEQLTAKEFEVLKRHPVVGCTILKDVKFLEKELPIILHHHERYDGSGYPYGLKEREIPLGARIMAVADAYDAMTAGRTYKKRLDRESALKELRDKSGKQFAPDIVEAFMKVAEMKKV